MGNGEQKKVVEIKSGWITRLLTLISAGAVSWVFRSRAIGR